MPPKGKKKRASLHLDVNSGQIKEGETEEVTKATETQPPVRQVVEVVDDEQVPEAIDTIKKDAEEIEEVAAEIEESVEKEKSDVEEVTAQAAPPTMKEEVSEDREASVESLFAKATSPQMPPEITVVGKPDRSIGVWVGAMIGIVLAIGVSLVLIVKKPVKLSFFAPKPTPTPTAAPLPTATPTPNVNRKDIKIAVLNGGGVVGAGSKMKAFLEGKGYTVASVGNAPAYTYDQTTINAKSGKDAYVSLLESDLSSDYTLASATGTVADSASYDIQVIVGK